MRVRDLLLPKSFFGWAWRIALALVVWLALKAFWLEPAGIGVAHHDIVLTRLDAEPLNGLRIAVISDLHAGAPYIDEAKIKKIIALTQKEQPDIILLLGDYVVTSRSGRFRSADYPIERTAQLLKGLDAPLGVYAVIGNHDRWESAGRVTRALQGAGFTVLENHSTVISTADRSFDLVGIGDDFTHAADPAQALAEVPQGHVALCFTHSPDVFPRLPRACGFTVAGHTHGGQVKLPFIGRPISNSRYGDRYAAGVFEENGKTLFVSTGIGTSGLPVRFGVPPVIDIVDIRVDAHR
jgi:uncharacterized protein